MRMQAAPAPAGTRSEQSVFAAIASASVIRSPGAAMLAMRAVSIMYALGRVLPPGLQWRLFSRLWAILSPAFSAALQARIPIPSVAFLHELRDVVLRRVVTVGARPSA